MSIRLLAPIAIVVTVVAGVAAQRWRAADAPAVPATSETLSGPSSATSHAAFVSSNESGLSRSLTIPVVGIESTSLHDSFNEPRSGGRTHEAIDIMAPRGTPVVSAADGRLLRLHRSKAGGLMVYAADATDQYILMYAHLDHYASGLVEGAPLQKGQLLGFVGTTGNAPANAPHLHFAIARGQPSVRWWSGVAVNPYPLLMSAPPSVPPPIQLAAADDVHETPTTSAALRTDSAAAPRRRSAARRPSSARSMHARTSKAARSTHARRSIAPARARTAGRNSGGLVERRRRKTAARPER